MKSLLDKLNVNFKLALLTAVTLISLIAVIFVSAKTLDHNLLEDRYIKTSQLTELATDTVKYFHQQYKLGNFTESEAKQHALSAIGSIHYDKSEYFWVNTLEHIMLSHPKEGLVGTNIKNISDPNGVYLFAEMVDLVSEKKEGFVSYQWVKQGSETPIDKISYVKLFEPWGWVIGTGIYLDDANDIFWESTQALMITALICVVLATWLSHEISKNIYQPLHTLRDLMVKVNKTNDLTLTSKLTSNDELAEIGNAFNMMISNFRNILINLSNSSGSLAAQAEELSAITLQINQGMNSQQNDVSSADIAANEMVLAIKEVAENTHTTLEAAQRTTNDTNNCVEVLDKNANSAQRLGERIEHSANQILALKNASKNIGEIVSSIQGVAEQTNLLALNAAIEAARAGEQGRGFAVVADEVRTLASRTSESTTSITSVVDLLQNGIEEAVTNMVSCQEQANESVELSKAASDLVKGMQEAITEVTDLNSMISAATEQQSATTQQVKDVIAQIHMMTEQTTTNAAHTAQSSESLADFATELNGMVANFNV